MDHSRQILTRNEIQRGKTALREDMKTGQMIAKCIQMHGESYAETSKWSRVTKVSTNSITFDWRRELDTRGKKVVYSTYKNSPGRFLKIYEADGSLSALYALKVKC
jgi:hypothetical protein